MDTVLARTFSAKPENKIEMRRPPWPNTPLHRYFGAKKPSKRNNEFVLSSLGYVQLYESTDKNVELGQDTSFVHLEERHRSDGPYTIYKQQRRLGICLNERAREKRLLRYYKYFQGFQRKLQVSRQFQQTLPKRGNNAAEMKKIMNYYKPSLNLTPASEQNLQYQDTEISNTNGTGDVYMSLKYEKCKHEDEINAENKDVGAKARNRPVSGKKYPDVTFAEYAATNAVLIPPSISEARAVDKYRRRCSIISTILETIEENKNEYDALESDLTENVNDYRLSVPYPGHKNEAAQREANTETTKLRGILKHWMPRKFDEQTKLIHEGSEITVADNESGDLFGNDKQITYAKFGKEVPVEKKCTEGHFKTSNEESGPLAGSQVVAMSKEGTLKRVIKKKEERARPLLQRGGRATSVAFTAADKEGGESEIETENQASEPWVNFKKPDIKPGKSSEIIKRLQMHQKKANMKSEQTGSKTSLKSKKGQSSGAARNQWGTIRFKGWDMGAPLASHVCKKLPTALDLSEQILEREEKLKLVMLEHSSVCDDTSKLPPTLSIDPKAYVEKNGIMHIFEQLTRKILTEQPESPLDLLQGIGSDFTEKREQKTKMKEDIERMRSTPTSIPTCSNPAPDVMPLQVKQHNTKPKYRIHGNGILPEGELTKKQQSAPESKSDSESIM